MAKPLKFHQTLNQAPRSMKHGKHRRAGAPAHRNPVIGTDLGTGGSSTAWFTSYAGSTWFSWEPRPLPEPIPYAGIRTGELTGYRAWFVVNEYELRSLAHHFIWEPGTTVSGDVMKPIDSVWNKFRSRPIMGGVYAHSSIGETLADIPDEAIKAYPFNEVRGDSIFPSYFLDDAGNLAATVDTFIGVAVGSVKMWGEVVEHERGYRSEFAKLQSIDRVFGAVDIDRLRAKYMPPQAPV